MKTIQYSSIIVVAIFIFVSPVFADTTIIEGNAETHTSVTTNIQGSGKVETHIKSTVNGITKTLDSNQPGTYTLDNNGTDTNTSTRTSNPSITSSPSALPTPHTVIHNSTFLFSLSRARQIFHDLIQKFLAAFHL